MSGKEIPGEPSMEEILKQIADICKVDRDAVQIVPHNSDRIRRVKMLGAVLLATGIFITSLGLFALKIPFEVSLGLNVALVGGLTLWVARYAKAVYD